MPYVKPEVRARLATSIADAARTLALEKWDAGAVNYFISTLLSAWWRAKGPKYATINAIVGVLTCIKDEFYSRVARPYEDHKIKENGDVF